jgi:hypothetical protein
LSVCRGGGGEGRGKRRLSQKDRLVNNEKYLHLSHIHSCTLAIRSPFFQLINTQSPIMINGTLYISQTTGIRLGLLLFSWRTHCKKKISDGNYVAAL